MYEMSDIWQMMFGKGCSIGCSETIICDELSAAEVVRVQSFCDTVACYSATIVTNGSANVRYVDTLYTLAPNDLYIHSPEVPYSILDVSDDFRCLTIMVDNDFVLSPDAVNNGATIFIFMRIAQPKLTLSDNVAAHLLTLLRLAAHYCWSDKPFRREAMISLYHLMLLEVEAVLAPPVVERRLSPRVEDTVVRFLKLASSHYADQRSLAFYADRLCISTAYLSRVVRQATGHTVQDFLSGYLVIEASRLMRHTSLSVAEVADRLHFSEPSSFIRFFTRMRGMSPKAYRAYCARAMKL